MNSLTGMLPGEIVKALDLDPPYRGDQIFSALSRGITDIDAVTTLSKELRFSISKQTRLYSTTVKSRQSDTDGSVKFRIELSDGGSVESVVLTDYRGRKTACLSTQLGCSVGCSFCKTGSLGFKRNLSPGEIVEQFLHMERQMGRIANIVYMGMGEPLQNADAVFQSISVLTHPGGRTISPRRITVSTAGTSQGLIKLRQFNSAMEIALSLQSAIQKKREALVPWAKQHPLPALKEAIKENYRNSGNRITLEYVLLRGINNNSEDITALAEFTEDISCVVNVIPWNPVPELPFQEPTEEEVKTFLHRCKERSIPVTRRYRRGRGINGACGQLGDTLGRTS